MFLFLFLVIVSACESSLSFLFLVATGTMIVGFVAVVAIFLEIEGLLYYG